MKTAAFKSITAFILNRYKFHTAEHKAYLLNCSPITATHGDGRVFIFTFDDNGFILIIDGGAEISLETVEYKHHLTDMILT